MKRQFGFVTNSSTQIFMLNGGVPSDYKLTEEEWQKQVDELNAYHDYETLILKNFEDDNYEECYTLDDEN